LIKANSEVDFSRLKTEGNKKEEHSKIEREEKINLIKTTYERAVSELRTTLNQKMAEIESKKFEAIMTTLGSETLLAIARVLTFVNSQEWNGKPDQIT